jgi:hypothetical protein
VNEGSYGQCGGRVKGGAELARDAPAGIDFIGPEQLQTHQKPANSISIKAKIKFVRKILGSLMMKKPSFYCHIYVGWVVIYDYSCSC